MERLGLSFDGIKINPKIVYGSKTVSDRIFLEKVHTKIGHHMTLLLKLGRTDKLTGYDEDTPLKVGPGIADIFSGSLLSFVSWPQFKNKGHWQQLVEVAM